MAAKAVEIGSGCTQPSHRTHNLPRAVLPLPDFVLAHPLWGTPPLIFLCHDLPTHGISADADNVLHSGDARRPLQYVLGMFSSFLSHVAKRLPPSDCAHAVHLAVAPSTTI